jgi:hypothetical protein
MRSNSWVNSIIDYSCRKCRFVAILLFWIEFEFWIEIMRISPKSLRISNIYFCRCFEDIHEFSFLFCFQMQIYNSLCEGHSFWGLFFPNLMYRWGTKIRILHIWQSKLCYSYIPKSIGVSLHACHKCSLF